MSSIKNVRTSKVTAISYPLSIISSPASIRGAYSVKLISSSYTGATLNIRRSSDNTTADFYSDNLGNLGTTYKGTGTTLTAWLGADIAFVTMWNDQSGLGINATQTTQAQQPTYDTINKCVSFNGTTTFLNVATAYLPTANSSHTVIMKHFQFLAGTLVYFNNGTTHNGFRKSDNGNKYLNWWYANDFTTTGGVISNNNIATFKYDNTATPNSTFYLNSVLDSTMARGPATQVGGGQQFIGKSIYGEFLNGQLYYLYIANNAMTDNNRLILEI